MSASSAQTAGFRRLLVVLPNWVGDVVLATPTLAALRAHFRHAHIGFVCRRYVADVIRGGGWHDELLFWPEQRGLARERHLLTFAGRLRAAGYDTCVLLTNSFRSALLAWLARVPRRVGYARDARGRLLTDRLKPRRDGAGLLIPSSVLPYYAALAERLGCDVADRRLRLQVTADDEEAATELRRRHGFGDGRPYAVINPGAKFGSSKCWPPERFGELCRRLAADQQLLPVVVGAPGEAELMQEIAWQAGPPTVCCTNPGTTLGSLKPIISDARVLVCNDTGPRHYGIAFGIPTVTIFGPTHQAWTDTGYAGEIKLQMDVPCGPCQLPRCPLDLRCLTTLSVATVAAAVRELLQRSDPPATAGTGPKSQRLPQVT
jgi:heptosyltransferase-2